MTTGALPLPASRPTSRRRVRSALATLGTLVALIPLSGAGASVARAEAAAPQAVLGAGTVTIDGSNPHLGGYRYRFMIAAATLRNGFTLGSMRVVQREPNSPHYSDVRLLIDCLHVQGSTVILSAETVSETTANGPVDDHIGFRVPVKIIDRGAKDQLVFGHGPPAPADCASDLFSDDVPMMPVRGNFRVH